MKKTIAVIFGGRSTEHDVSIITAHIPIIQSLIAMQKYQVLPIYIGKDNSWYSDEKMNDLAYFTGADFEGRLAKEKKIQLLFDKGLNIVWPGIRSKTIHVDIVFPAMHGTFGEDGSLMGLLRMADVPFVGCDLFASAVAMDKVLTKQVAHEAGVAVVPYVWFTKSDWLSNAGKWKEEMGKLKLPLFVKPVHLGSSIGITKVKQSQELVNAIEVAFHYDDKVLVEEGVENLIEVTLPIMGNDTLQFASIERPLNKSEMFDFNDKYLSGGKKGGGANTEYSEIPAKIDEQLAEQVLALGEKTYRTLGCAGTARIDFLIEGSLGKVYMNEVNTLPGSLYHHNWKKSGISNIDLVAKLIALAEERYESRRSEAHVFQSDILKKMDGPKLGA